MKGWSDCDQLIIEYWNHRDELSFEKGFIFRGQKIVIPKSLRAEMLNQMNTGHLGVKKALERAKDSIFWPGMTKAITDYVLSCEICLRHERTVNIARRTTRAISKLGSDIFTFE